MTSTCMGDVRLTPRVVEKILNYQRNHDHNTTRMLISSVVDGRLILTIRSECKDLSHTSFVYPIYRNPQYDPDFNYLWTVSLDTGERMTKEELEMYNGDIPIEDRIGKYWNVILVRDEREMNVVDVLE